MRENTLKAKLAAGESAFGTMVFEFASPGMPAILAGAGAEFALYDMEHSGFDMEEIKRQVSYCRGLDITPLVRPPGKDYHLAARLLDLGVMGLMFQMVESAEEARELVSWTRYPPAGVRGAIFNSAHDDYAAGDIAEKMRVANERAMVMALIETTKGVENVEEIMAVPGIDVGHVGHFDLSLTMGIPGQFDHPDFVAAVDRVIAACDRNGKTLGCTVPTVAWGKAWMARGFRMVSYSADLWLMQEALGNAITALKKG